MATVFGDTAQSFWQRVMLMKSLTAAQLAFPRYWYEFLDAYYINNSLYDEVQMELYENAIWTPGMKPLRNPTNRGVEFHVSKLWPGALPKALPIISENKKIQPVVAKIWEWSNWATQKQVFARQIAGLGDGFIKIAQKREGDEVTRVYMDPIKPANVVEFDEDERGFLTYIRIDIPAGERVHTEVWSKAFGGYRIWLHDNGLDHDLEELGRPSSQGTFEDLKFDFIPIVHAKYRDLGQPRGVPCFLHVLDKIDEANRMATRLHQILFRYNKPTTAVLANDNDPSGRPLPPPVLTGSDGQLVTPTRNVLAKGDDDVWLMPGRSKVEYLVPDLNYADYLKTIDAQMEEISKDLPEVLYYELKDKDNLSGVALRTLLSPAIDRVIEARGNAEPALVRAHQMAITIATIHGIVESVGDFDKGDFVHVFAERDVIAKTSSEKSANVQADTAAGIPLVTSMKHNGYEQDEIDDMIQSEEYKLMLAQKAMNVVKTAVEATIPLETALTSIGWTKEQLANMGTARLAAITLEQEDVIPDTEQ